MFHLSRSQVGEVIYLDGNTNYKIVDNDLLATGITIHTGGHGLHQVRFEKKASPGCEFLK